MFSRSITLLRVAGFPIRIDASWIFIALLVTWSLASGAFRDAPVGPATRWSMAALGALGLFGSIVLHEMGHGLVARRAGLRIRGITLFIFGGVAEMEEEPRTPGAEFRIAIAGPLVSLALAAVFGVGWHFGPWVGAPQSVTALAGWLALANFALAAFNLVPGFPLDGGRVLRAALWATWGDLRRATRAASWGGRLFAYALMGLGVFQFFAGNAVGGAWSFLIGLFLNHAAIAPYRQLLAREALEGVPVRQLMRLDPMTVPRSIPIGDLVTDYVYRHQFKALPVVEDGRLLGCVTLDRVKAVPREEWPTTSVGAIADPCTEANTIRPDEDALAALARMGRGPTTRLMVVEDGRLVGMLSLRDLLGFLALRLELEPR